MTVVQGCCAHTNHELAIRPQAAAEAQAEAWEAAERTLNQRIADAESRAGAAAERERLTAERTQVRALCVHDTAC